MSIEHRARNNIEPYHQYGQYQRYRQIGEPDCVSDRADIV